jgi:hypothetical protein
MSIVHLTEEEEARYAELQQFALECARDGETATLESMVAAGLPVNLADERGNTLLMLAAYRGREETARMPLARGAEVDRRNDHGQTPLGGVAFKGDLPLVEALLEGGAAVDADNGGGRTPLMYAAMFGHRLVVNRLLEVGADPHAKIFFGLSAPRLARLTGAVRGIFARSTG